MYLLIKSSLQISVKEMSELLSVYQTQSEILLKHIHFFSSVSKKNWFLFLQIRNWMIYNICFSRFVSSTDADRRWTEILWLCFLTAESTATQQNKWLFNWDVSLSSGFIMMREMWNNTKTINTQHDFYCDVLEHDSKHTDQCHCLMNRSEESVWLNLSQQFLTYSLQKMSYDFHHVQSK